MTDHTIRLGRPDLAALIAEHAAAAKAEAPDDACGQSRELFVCVCGPPGLVRAARTAVTAARKTNKCSIGFHAEEPSW